MTQALQFMGLPSALESPDFKLLEVHGGKNQADVLIELLHEEETGKSFHISQKNPKTSRIVDTSGVIDALSDFFDQGYEQAICHTSQGSTSYTRTPKGVRKKFEPTQVDQSKDEIKIDIKYLLETARIRRMLIELGVLTSEGTVRREQYNKLIQVKNFLNIILETLPELQKLKPLNIVDGACGKSYLSFVLYYFLREEWGLDAHFRCIDTSNTLIQRCQKIQSSLSCEHMEFVVGAIKDYQSDDNIGMLYSLHGCDTASDQAIAAGIHLQSKIILVAPCCHFELGGQLRQHPLKSLTKFGLLEDRFAAILTDGLRALALEAAGYDTSVLRFVMDDISPKNTLLRGIKRSVAPDPRAIQQFQKTRDLFGVSPSIERLLPDVFRQDRSCI
ncbi:MAG TPA: SAM-dependent methyltransferase [Pyrinomonadaceae bacterium]